MAFSFDCSFLHSFFQQVFSALPHTRHGTESCSRTERRSVTYSHTQMQVHCITRARPFSSFMKSEAGLCTQELGCTHKPHKHRVGCFLFTESKSPCHAGHTQNLYPFLFFHSCLCAPTSPHPHGRWSLQGGTLKQGIPGRPLLSQRAVLCFPYPEHQTECLPLGP